MPIAAFSALPPQISSKWVAFSFGGNAADAKGQVAHRDADAENTWRYFGRFILKVHPGIRHAGSAWCRNLGPELTDWSIVRFPLCADGGSLMQP